MKKKGSITVFLALILVLLFSLVLTTLEAARIAGGMAYVQMLSAMAGDSVKASYYYPLFQQYGLFGVFAEKDGMYSEEKIKASLKEDLEYGLTQMQGGLLAFETPEVTILGVNTMLSGGGRTFLEQIREEAVLEGAKDLLTGILSGTEVKEAASAGELYQKQEETIQKTATVTSEILRLMELCDGICTDEKGLCFDKEGNLKTTNRFVKCLASGTDAERKEKYANEEIYAAIKGYFCQPKTQAEELSGLMQKGVQVQAEIDVLELEIESYRKRQEDLLKEMEESVSEEEKQMLSEEGKILAERLAGAVDKRDEKIEWLDIALMDIEEQYEVLKSELEEVRPILAECWDVLLELEEKQLVARLSVTSYETFLKSRKDSVSAELYTVFEEELQKLKLYTGMDEAGYRVEVMQETIDNNIGLLNEIMLPEFSAGQMFLLSQRVEMVAERISEYSTEGLWFSYGNVVASKTTEKNVIKAAEQILSKNILSLVGLSEEKISTKRMDGTELPSDGLEKIFLQTDLKKCFEEVSVMFSEGNLGALFEKGAETMKDVIALEWYARSYFGCFGRELLYTRLSYEREYFLFGGESDSRNLLSGVLYLTAVRSVFTMASILGDAQRMAELENVAVTVAGFTGIPGLVAAVKCSLLFLWSVEEALVDVTALLDGKRLPIVSLEGCVDFNELFLFNGALAAQKAGQKKEQENGLAYEDYLTLFSLLQSVEKKAYRCMDLIQENLRYRYDENFTMRLVLTGVSFSVKTEVKQRVNTGVIGANGYVISIEEKIAY